MANTVSGQLRDANVKGKPRDLMDTIFNVAPTDTPFLTMCGKSTASQTLHEWQTDTLASPAENAVMEGADTTTFSESYTTELSNRTQILKKAINVSGTVTSRSSPVYSFKTRCSSSNFHTDSSSANTDVVANTARTEEIINHCLNFLILLPPF